MAKDTPLKFEVVSDAEVPASHMGRKNKEANCIAAAAMKQEDGKAIKVAVRDVKQRLDTFIFCVRKALEREGLKGHIVKSLDKQYLYIFAEHLKK